AVCQTEWSRQLAGVLRRAALLGPRPGRVQGIAQEAAPGAAVAADHHVLEDGHAAEQGQVLERASDAQLRDAVSRHAEERLPAEEDLAAIAFVEARQAVE